MLLILLLRSDSPGFMQSKERVFSEIITRCKGEKLNKVQVGRELWINRDFWSSGFISDEAKVFLCSRQIAFSNQEKSRLFCSRSKKSFALEQ